VGAFPDDEGVHRGVGVRLGGGDGEHAPNLTALGADYCVRRVAGGGEPLGRGRALGDAARVPVPGSARRPDRAAAVVGGGWAAGPGGRRGGAARCTASFLVTALTER